MDQPKMEAIVKLMSEQSEGEHGFVIFTYQNLQMQLISDVAHNRMRIITPVAVYDELSEEIKEAMLLSNFHRSLDARYALSDGVVYSAYIHPLQELTEEQLQSAVNQVSNLALSFGGEYSSGELSFAGG